MYAIDASKGNMLWQAIFLLPHEVFEEIAWLTSRGYVVNFCVRMTGLDKREVAA